MKNKRLIIFLIVILTILAIAITSFMFMLLSGKSSFGIFNFVNFGSSTVSSELVFDKTYNEIFEEIIVDVDAGDIYIYASDNEEVVVNIYGSAEQLDISDDDNLSIKYVAKKCVGFCINVEKAKVEITIPKDYEGKLDINNKYGDTSIDEFMMATGKVENDYGNIEILGLLNADVNNSCGNILVGTVSTVNVDNNYGDIKIKKVLSRLNVNADCGDIDIDEINIEVDSYIENSMGNIVVGKTNDIRIEADTSLGNVNVRNNNTSSLVTLKIDNSCGDITVKN